jgi:hypothetical protein
MLTFCSKLLLIALLSLNCEAIGAQEIPSVGSLEISGRVRIGGKPVKLERKRFYLLRGGLAENKTLVEKLKATEFGSRNCFYSQTKASPQFICWLKANNCESPYCRKIIKEDAERVPEFQAAYQKGLRQFGRPEVALDWLTTNLSSNLREGFYLQQKSLLAGLLGELKPLQSAMTDSTAVKALFIDIPLNFGGTDGKKSETFFISNLLPIEIGDKSYLWACQVDIGTAKRAVLPLAVPENNKPVKNCEVIVRDLPLCKTESCPQ